MSVLTICQRSILALVGVTVLPLTALAATQNTPGPIALQEYLKGENTESGDRFGYSLANHGDRLVVGAPWESSSSSGVNGDGADNSMLGAGAAYVFRRVGGQWVQEAYLKASNPDSSDGFGKALAIADGLIVVGCSAESSGAQTIDGDGSDNSTSGAGAAYVFELVGGQWAQTAYLKANNAGEGDQFGSSVAAEGDLVLVGASQEDSLSTTINVGGADPRPPNLLSGRGGCLYLHFGCGRVHHLWWCEGG